MKRLTHAMTGLLLTAALLAASQAPTGRLDLICPGLTGSAHSSNGASAMAAVKAPYRRSNRALPPGTRAASMAHA